MAGLLAILYGLMARQGAISIGRELPRTARWPQVLDKKCSGYGSSGGIQACMAGCWACCECRHARLGLGEAGAALADAALRGDRHGGQRRGREQLGLVLRSILVGGWSRRCGVMAPVCQRAKESAGRLCASCPWSTWRMASGGLALEQLGERERELGPGFELGGQGDRVRPKW